MSFIEQLFLILICVLYIVDITDCCVDVAYKLADNVYRAYRDHHFGLIRADSDQSINEMVEAPG